jgi:hypothetical protein
VHILHGWGGCLVYFGIFVHTARRYRRDALAIAHGSTARRLDDPMCWPPIDPFHRLSVLSPFAVQRVILVPSQSVDESSFYDYLN